MGSALAQADVVGSAFAFRIWSTVSGAGPFKPGTYTLRTNMGVPGRRQRPEGRSTARAGGFGHPAASHPASP